MTLPQHKPKSPPDWAGTRIRLDFYTDDDDPVTLEAHAEFDHMAPDITFRVGETITFTVTLTDLARVIANDAPEYQK